MGIKSKVVYFLKHNNAFKQTYMTMGSLFFRLLGGFIKTDESLALFVANIGKGYSGSPREIYEYISKNEVYRDIKCVWAFNEPEQFEKYGLNTVKFDTMQYFITSLKAKYWITDVNIERSLRYKKKGTRFLNTWHGIALKYIGNDDPASGRYNYSYLDFLCVSGAHDKRVYSSALKAPEKSFLMCGMPRNDRLYHVTEEERLAVREKLGIGEDQIALLYAPTWRDSTNNGASYDLAVPMDLKKWEQRLGDKYVLLFRAHDRTTKVMNVQFNEFVRDYSTYEDINDLYIAADILITDYSSVIFDYSILGKPLYCFAYDYDAYKKERGMYFDPEQEYPGGVIRTEDELLDKIESTVLGGGNAEILAFNRKFMEYGRGEATKTCAEKLFCRGAANT